MLCTLQALVGQLESRTMSDKERLTLVEVMAPFTYFYCHQVGKVLYSRVPPASTRPSCCCSCCYGRCFCLHRDWTSAVAAMTFPWTLSCCSFR
jgi:hypothetical protein